MIKLLFVIALNLVAATTFAAIAEDGAYSLDKDHANVGFSVTHLGISNTVGRFNTMSGDFNLVSGGDSTVTFSIETDSIDTNQKRRDKHLKSNDFFNVKKFKTIDFKSTAVTYSEEGDPLTITGDMTMLGETKSVTFDVTPVGAGNGPAGDTRAGYSVKTVVLRSDFGLGQKFNGVVGDEVTVDVQIEIIKK